MAKDNLLEQFKHYFRVVYAGNETLRQEAYRIRHDVFCEELGLEEKRENHLETDEFDPYSYHFLLQYLPLKTYAGTIRVVMPPPDRAELPLPFEKYCAHGVDKSIIDPSRLERGTFAEVSRLAVPLQFRRRANEQGRPYVLAPVSTTPNSQNNEEDRSQFPHIALGLYLTSAAFGLLCNLKYVFVMIEPRLARALARLGLASRQAGDVIDYHGQRALFYLSRELIEENMDTELAQLLTHIQAEVAREFGLSEKQNQLVS